LEYYFFDGNLVLVVHSLERLRHQSIPAVHDSLASFGASAKKIPAGLAFMALRT
jgi:hypothetical protein